MRAQDLSFFLFINLISIAEFNYDCNLVKEVNFKIIWGIYLLTDLL